MDNSNGYERIAASFITVRGQAADGIGAASIRHWARTLPPGATVLDLGCGTGIPISGTLISEGMNVYGVDASPTLVKAFRRNFPGTPVCCESVVTSPFFNLKFDAIVAWGLLFLLSEDEQAAVIQKMANALRPGGRLLFTAPSMAVEWEDVMTGLRSVSLGTAKYKALLAASRLSMVEEFEDEGENHYFHSRVLE
ncbi:class I SAM-dependent methyltransferase [Parapedobacter koreensis]|uniref:Methyltransferase domain-containing protein n=1 Tax=Parapedobacter koreensis TaxID=332977 RepID=A0A1H7U476_9SPHI|nr:class I SAM-dependent methyltransferase [Parapedobacter koreensis]SEL91506.1 Methyltransferase domain-containing protein [Parapedobacter koreensis]